MKQSFVTIATIGKPVGLQGAVWVNSFCDTLITNYLPWRIGHALDAATIYTQAHCKRFDADKNRLLIMLPEVTNKKTAQFLCHMSVWIEQTQLAALAVDEYYWHHLIGCEVIKQDTKESFGYVDHMMRQGSADIMVVISKIGKRVLIPFIQPQVICRVDIVACVIEVDWDYY